MKMNPETFGPAVDAYGQKDCDVGLTMDAIRAMTPPGLILRPSHNGEALNLHLVEEPGQSFALFYLRQPRARAHDPALVVLACTAIDGIAAHLAALEALEPPPGCGAAFDAQAVRAAKFAPLLPGQFSRSIEAGYTVQKTDAWEKPDGSEGGRWAYDAPDGDGCGVGYASERAAWEAADRHRMFGESGASLDSINGRLA